MNEYPVITTRGIVAFPMHKIVLEIGRQISLNSLAEAKEKYNNKIVLVSQRNIKQDDVKSFDEIYGMGTLVEISQIENRSNKAAKRISIVGMERFQIKDLFLEKNVLKVKGQIVKTKNNSLKLEKNSKFMKEFSRQIDTLNNVFLIINKHIKTNMPNFNVHDNSPDKLIDIVANFLPIPFEKKQLILETIDLEKRLKLINEIVIKESQTRSKIDKNIDDSIKNTLDAQQKEFLLREKLKVIKEELGEISTKDSEVDKWKKTLKDKRFPKYVAKKALEEIKRYEAMLPISAEAHVSKGYIEWLLKLPWKTFSIDINDLKKAKDVLNKNHFGLKDVKDRIIEYLAVKINTHSNASPIITLLGPPGVGKTSLARSIADAMGRKMIKVSLGGIRDEAEIRGHRRTYVGAMPGKIIQAINSAGTSNPIVLLDEIDKMASDYRGDPASAMLEVLDPEQNAKFQDHYLELEYDLSNVMFFATANFIDQIPRPLLDRVELININQYTSEEKLEIAKRHLIPKVLRDHGLKKDMFTINDKVINHIINKYTLEAGVRNLERTLAKIARKIVLLKLQNKIKNKTYEITLNNIKKLLGKEQVFKEKLDSVKSEVGLTNGMYYSSMGGGILPIEATTYPAKNGGTILTGSIKEVMQESLKIAVAYLRANAKKFGINFNFENNIIQVHVPEGATPKDGPSAGIAFATAVLSTLIKKPVPRNISLTGEITLRGKVLMIGGLKEKTIGAVEAGVNKIFIPKSNEKDLDDLAKKVKENSQIILVDSYQEVFKQIFG